MGYSCRKENVLFVLAGLEAFLIKRRLFLSMNKLIKDIQYSQFAGYFLVGKEP